MTIWGKMNLRGLVPVKGQFHRIFQGPKAVLRCFQDIVDHSLRVCEPCCIRRVLYPGAVMGEMEIRPGSVPCRGCIIDRLKY